MAHCINYTGEVTGWFLCIFEVERAVVYGIFAQVIHEADISPVVIEV